MGQQVIVGLNGYHILLDDELLKKHAEIRFEADDVQSNFLLPVVETPKFNVEQRKELIDFLSIIFMKIPCGYYKIGIEIFRVDYHFLF